MGTLFFIIIAVMNAYKRISVSLSRSSFIGRCSHTFQLMNTSLTELMKILFLFLMQSIQLNDKNYKNSNISWNILFQKLPKFQSLLLFKESPDNTPSLKPTQSHSSIEQNTYITSTHVSTKYFTNICILDPLKRHFQVKARKLVYFMKTQTR